METIEESLTSTGSSGLSSATSRPPAPIRQEDKTSTAVQLLSLPSVEHPEDAKAAMSDAKFINLQVMFADPNWDGIDVQAKGPSNDADFTAMTAKVETIMYASENKRSLTGVDCMIMAYAMLEGLAAARITNNASVLLQDLTIAVFAAYTQSKSLASVYDSLSKTSMFRKFEIVGREADNKAAWVSNSKMNASALKIVGHIVVAMSPRGTFLGTLGNTKGTIFNPPDVPKDQMEKETFAALTAKAAVELTSEERRVPSMISQQFSTVVIALNKIFGSGDATLEVAIANVSKIRNTRF